MNRPARSGPTLPGAGRAVAAYVAGVFVAAALSAPWVYRAAQAAAAAAPALAWLAAHPLHRYVQRLALVFAVAGLPALLRALGLRGWRAVGLARPAAHRRVLAAGVLAGAGAVLAAAAVPLAAGARTFDPAATPARIAVRAATALGVAAAVALLEELLFRGVVLGGLRRAGGAGGALAAGSALYAGVHVLGRAPAPPAATWDAGLVVLRDMVAGGGAGADVWARVPSFLTLWLVGAYLGRRAERAGTLYASVGVHAGGIVVLQLYGLVTTVVPGADPHVWGTGRLVDGWAALGVLAALTGWDAVRGRARRGSGHLGGVGVTALRDRARAVRRGTPARSRRRPAPRRAWPRGRTRP